MKKRFLPLSLLLVIMMLGQTITFADNGGHYVPRVQGSATADSYMSELRANQHTGLIDPALMIKAAQGVKNVKGGAEEAPLYWLSMGPDNMGGQTTAVLYDNTKNAYGNPNGVVYIGSKGGGVYKTYNHGITWHQVGNQNLMVSCMVQNAEGTIFVGTGDCGAAANFNGLGQQSYSNSFIGSGMYKIVNDVITPINSTVPTTQNDVTEWSFVNDMVFVGNKLVVATESGLKYSSDEGATWAVAKDADGALLEGNAMEVKAIDGDKLIAAIDGNVYIGTLDALVCHSAANVEYDENHNISALPVSDGFLDVAVAPSDVNVLYASCINTSGAHSGVYVSLNQGATWEVALPASSAEQGHNLYSGFGMNNHGLVVSPNNPYSVYVLGYNLWELSRAEGATGYFITHQHSYGTGIDYTSPYYLHVGLHTMVFNPYNEKEFYIGTDGGIYKGVKENGFTFVNCNRNYITTRMFSVAYSNNIKRVMGAALDHGTIMIEGDENVNHETTGMWVYPLSPAGAFSDGNQPGSCAFSMVNPEKIFVSTKNGGFYRSETAGADWVSTNFLTNISSSGVLNTSSFRFPFALLESFDDAENPVEVWAFNEDTVPTYQVQAMSALDYPFDVTLDTPLAAGDSVLVHDPISAKMYLAFKDCFYFTRDALEFSSSPTWYLLSKKKDYGFTGDPLSMAVTPDGDKVFVGFKDGKLCRIDNINTVVDAATGCLDSVQCQVTTTFFELPVEGQCITSIAVDPSDFNKVIVTLGNYGNESYVLYSTDALSAAPTFVSKQGNLPLMPVYSSVIEMTTGKVLLGTEHGVYMTGNINNPTWVSQNDPMGDVPVMELKQQIVNHPDQTVWKLFVENDTTSYYIPTIYEGVRNQGMIYAATYGRGLFRCENFRQEYESVDEDPVVVETPVINMYPNPVRDLTKVNFTMNSKGNVSYEVYDICGRRIMSQSLGSYADGSYEVNVDMSTLRSGAYIFRLNQGGKSSSVKFVVY